MSIFFLDIMSPRRGRSRSYEVFMDEELASVPHVLPPQGESPILLEFLVPPMCQAKLFPPITHKAFQAFTIYWYVQAQTQVEAQIQVTKFRSNKANFLCLPWHHLFHPEHILQ